MLQPIFSCRIVLFITLVLFLLNGCKTASGPIDPNSSINVDKEALQCDPTTRKHFIYHVLVDGKDAGREVRSVFTAQGPFGDERVTISHLSKQYRTHAVELDRFEVRQDRYLKKTGTILRSSYIAVDDSSTMVSLLGFNGVGWERISERRDSVLDPIRNAPTTVNLSGNELVGFGLNDHLRKIAAGEKDHAEQAMLYIPSFAAPISIEFTVAKEGNIKLEGETHEGHWVTAKRSGTSRVVLTIFVAKDGTILEEHYPTLHQVRRLTRGDLTPRREFLDPFVGLFSNCYLGLPNAASRASYEIVTLNPIENDSLQFLGAPKNQTLQKLDECRLSLDVAAGGPDGNNPPTAEDLSATQYINTDAKAIVDAFKYLKSHGKKGTLPPHRKENAIPVIARSSTIADDPSFWNDPDRVAKLVMEYVHAILPNKHHTYAMSDAVTTLQNGLGDCTEHSVLFASLMRVAKIPTRLVSGMYLAHGGKWVFHMWNEYWDNHKWQSIDTAVGPELRPGAHYVALGLGASNFSDHRNKIAFFLDRSFSGMSINLTGAGNNGEALHLAKPRKEVFSGHDAIIFNASTLIGRGDYQDALTLVKNNYDPEISPLAMELLLTELYFLNGKLDQALKRVEKLTEKTSLAQNVRFLKTLQLKIHLAAKNHPKAKKSLENLSEHFKEDPASLLFFKAKFLFETGAEREAIQLLDNGVLTYPENFDLLTSFVKYVAQSQNDVSKAFLKQALERSNHTLFETHFADISSIKAAAALHLRLGDLETAVSMVDHGLILSPKDLELKTLGNQIRTLCK